MNLTKIQTTKDFKIYLTYSNGEHRVFDMMPLLSQKPWTKIDTIEKFSLAQINFNTVAWPNGINIAPETLYLDSQALVEAEERNH